MKLTKRPATLLLGIWLILMGLVALLDLSFVGLRPIMAALAIVAGVLIALDR